MKRVNCAIYVRKSTEKGLDMEFNSLQNQEESCKNYILSQAFNGWEYFKTYIDSGISGGTMNRAALQEMLEDMKKGLIQIVVTYKVDRLSRSIIDFHNMMKEFEKYNCDFVSITQSFDTSTSMGKLTLNMLLSFAQFEREVSSERIRDKIAASKRKGYWTGGMPPFGYGIENRKLVVDEKEAEDVRWIFEMYLKLKSLDKLRDYLRDAGVRSKRWTTKNGREIGGNELSSSMIARILRSEVYIGRIEQKKDKLSYEGLHEPIIDKEVFDQVQDILNNNQLNHKETYKTDAFLLSGKIFDCNGVVFRNNQGTKDKVKKYRYYSQCRHYLPAGDLEELTVEVVKNLFEYQMDEILDKSAALEFRMVDFESLTHPEQHKVVKILLDKVIFDNNRLTFFISLDSLSDLKAFRKTNYLNSTGEKMPDNCYLSSDEKHLVIEKEIHFNHYTSTSKYIGKNRRIISISENASHLVKALSTGWRYKKMQEEGLTVREIGTQEHRSDRTIYKYLNLNYLSPNIINDTMESRVPQHVNLQTLFEIASKYEDFEEQEREYSTFY
jgi:site-specific DNA recombinase